MALVLVPGCFDSSAGHSAIVSGKVTLGGLPVTAGTVLFMTEQGEAASAELQPDGSYVLHCSPARFNVAVMPPPAVDPLAQGTSAAPGGSQAIKSSIPKRYHDFGSSGLTVEVKEGDSTFNIELTR